MISFYLRGTMLAIIFAALLGFHACAQSPKPPSWLSGHAELLPPVTSAELEAIANAWPHLCVEGRFRSEVDWQAFKTVADMGAQAEFALVWLYAQEEPMGYPWPHGRRAYMLRMLTDDTVSEPWFIPLLRFRIGWIKDHFHDHPLNLDESDDLCSEIGAIQGYVNKRGLDNDLNLLMALVAALAESNETVRYRLDCLLEPAYSEKERATDQWRRKTRPHPYAFHEHALLQLTARNTTLAEAVEHLSGRLDSLAWSLPKYTPSDKVAPAILPRLNGGVASPTSDQPYLTRFAIGFVIIFLAGCGMLCVLLKRRAK